LKLLNPLPPGRDCYETIVLSGLLSSANRGEVQQILEAGASRLKETGILVLHDAFLPAAVLPPPEVVLGTLARRISRGGCRSWSISRLREALQALGFRSVVAEPLPAGTVLVTAKRS
jgi:predicted O-methyltransferase YrrM